jgi:phenylalanyl-tRNA synthetase beta chain
VKVLLSWLREFAPLEGGPVELGDQMSDLGMAVESMQVLGGGLGGIVVAKVLDLRPHPDADRIQIVDVDAGDGEALQVCCGAFNMTVGDLVPFATIGATMPSGMEIGRRKMRGEWSNGMLCSSEELGLGAGEDGIMILDSQLDAPVEVGVEIAEALSLDDDVLYDLEINPNRPDAMSMAGVARDLAARLGTPFTLLDPLVPESGKAAGKRVSVDVQAPDLCGRFLARVLDDVTVGPSPGWLARRLALAGMRPINNVVDVSNYVMLELGQPNHTYDLDRLPGGALIVRWADEGERIVTLDGQERVLDAGDGVIADSADTAAGIAGVMGGASTEVSDATSSVLLEMAWWDPMTIARSSRRLQLRSEASMRFERGTDPEVVELAARRFADLLGSSAQLAPGVVDRRGGLPDRSPVRVRTERVNGLLGTQLSTSEIERQLTPIGFACRPTGGDLDVTVPPWRYDTATETDVIEEVARHVSYSKIPAQRPRSVHTGALTKRQRDRRRLRALLAGLGLSEAMPTPFLAPADLEATGVRADGVTITNPLAAEESVLRTSLRPGLLKALAYNASHRNHGVGLFEIGHIFLPSAGDSVLPDEPEHVAVALGGRDATAAVAVLDAIVDEFAVEDLGLPVAVEGGLHPTRTSQVTASGVPVGWVGEIDPAILEAMGIGERVGWLGLDLDALTEQPHDRREYSAVSRYPSSDVDLAFVVPDEVPADDLRGCVLDAGGELLASVELFDVYRGEALGEGRRSLAWRLRFQALDRTLTDAELADARQAVIDAVTSSLPAELRS